MAARKKSRAAGSRAAKRSTRGAKPKSAGAKRARPSPGRAAPRRKALPKKRAARPATRRRAAGGAPAAPQAPSAIGFRAQHIDYTTHAMDEVRRFYTEQLGFARFEYDEKMQYLMVTTGPSSSLGFTPPMDGPPEDWRPPREPVIYLIVEDVERAHEELRGKGVTFEQAPADMPWGHRVAVVRDPEGRAVWLAQIIRGA